MTKNLTQASPTKEIIVDQITSLKKIYSGKVRDLYAIDENSILMVASDRLSTFDIILKQPIPQKGVFLTQISLFWFKYLEEIMPNHLVEDGQNKIDALVTADELNYLKGRSMVVKPVTPLPIEVIVRGYLAGSAYNDYQRTGLICGIKQPSGLQNAQKLTQAIFTPSTKAAIGNHDENITLTECRNLIGNELTHQVEQFALALYNKAKDKALECGIIIADTKFEFGIDANGQLILIDEVLTPDSSRFWDAKYYKLGSNPPSFDKQFVRDYLNLEVKWNKTPPIPILPPAIILKTIDKYVEIANRLDIRV